MALYSVKTVVGFLGLCVTQGMAAGVTEVPDGSESNVLVISNLQENREQQRNILDIMLGHFAHRLTHVDSQSFVRPDASYTHVVYFGGPGTQMSSKVADYLKERKGKTLIIGEGIQALPSTNITVQGEAIYDSLQTEGSLSTSLAITHIMKKVAVKPGQGVHGTGHRQGQSSPFMVSAGHYFYLAPMELDQEVLPIMGEALFAFFPQTPVRKHPALYLRLEDVHPNADATRLMAVAKYLAEENIPYMVGVIPAYRHPQTGRLKTLAEVPAVLRALRYMQDHGASVLLHGYSHQYQQKETGEGFEFWDVDHNHPIYAEPDKSSPMPKDPALQNAWLSEGRAYEKKYISSRVMQGLETLVKAGLYPLAFEAPHYTLSQAGYGYVAKHFNTYVGHVQVTDQDYRAQISSLLTSRPAFLGGMRSLPENLGMVQGDDPAAISKIKAAALEKGKFKNATLGVFYHPYLGAEKLKELVAELKKIPHLQWINLREENTLVKAPGIMIRGEKGKLITDISSEYKGGLSASKSHFWWMAAGLSGVGGWWLFTRRRRAAGAKSA